MPVGLTNNSVYWHCS